MTSSKLNCFVAPFGGNSRSNLKIRRPGNETIDCDKSAAFARDFVKLTTLCYSSLHLVPQDDSLVITGIALRYFDPKFQLEDWLERRKHTRAASRYDIPIPAPLVGMAVLGGINAMSIVGCYAYYPASDEVFAEMQITKADALSFANLGDSRKVDHYIGLWDAWSRRLEVGVFLREWRLTRYQHMKARILREKLELLRHDVEDGDRDATKAMVRQVQDAHERLRRAFEAPKS